MRAIRIVGKVLLSLAALPVGLALLAGLPIGALALLRFLLGEAGALLFAPGMALYLFGFCLPMGIREWRSRSGGKGSPPLRLPGAVWLAAGSVVALGLGQVLLASGRTPLFWLCFVLAAALPPAAALALASQRLGPATTRRRAMAGLLSGSLLSTHLAILATAAVSVLAYLMVVPLRDLVAKIVASRGLEQLFYSPALVLAMVEAALVAPVVEELVKPLGAILLAKRLRGPAEAFLVGMAGGVGFAILENMLYESAGPQLWASITVLRAVGGALHPLNAGMVAVGWYGVRNGLPGAWGRLVALYGLAVGLHALWNGGLTLLYSDAGAHFLGTESWKLDLYGLGQPGAVVTFMLLEALVLWRLLFLVTARLRDPLPEGNMPESTLPSGKRPEAEPLLALRLERPRRLALWAGGVALLVVPVAALYGPLVVKYLAIASPVR